MEKDDLLNVIKCIGSYSVCHVVFKKDNIEYTIEFKPIKSSIKVIGS
jgi:hypothetical protein